MIAGIVAGGRPLSAATSEVGGASWGNVASLLHFDGPDNSVSFTDEKGGAWTPGSGAKITTNATDFGGAAGNFTATNSAHVKIATNASLRLTGQFCIEMRLRPTAVDADIYWFTYSSASNLWLYTSAIGQLSMYIFGSATPGIPIVADNTYHIALTRDASDLMRLFVNGELVYSATNSYVVTSNPVIQVGGAPAVAGSNKGGRCFIDEFRMVVNEPVYISPFTPRVSPFPNS